MPTLTVVPRATDTPDARTSARQVEARVAPLVLAYNRQHQAYAAAEELARTLVTQRLRLARKHIEREYQRLERLACREGWRDSTRTRRIRAMRDRTCQALGIAPTELRDMLRFSARRYPRAALMSARWERLIRRGHLFHVSPRTVYRVARAEQAVPHFWLQVHPLSPRVGALCDRLKRLYNRDWREYDETFAEYEVVAERAAAGDELAERSLDRLMGRVQHAVDVSHRSGALHSRAFALALRLSRAECDPRLGALPLP